MSSITTEHFSALFDPDVVVVAGASTHPGKFGFVALHNILASGFQGEVFATNREEQEVLGRPTYASIDALQCQKIDLVFLCTPPQFNEEVLRQAAAKGAKAVFVASAGYREASAEGAEAERQLVALGQELDLLIVGPNGQGLVSTPKSLCAQIVAPYPPAGSIGIASQSGNFVSSFLNLSRQAQVGVSRAISVGNAASVGIVEMAEFFADDPATSVALLYVEGIENGRDFAERMRRVCQKIPVVIMKGGRSQQGARAAASHTGSLATDDVVFDGMCRQIGAQRANSVAEAFDFAAAFATMTLPQGPRLGIVTTVGGWGVLAADASAHTDLQLADLPPDLEERLNELLPPRWSKNNPIDLAGGETKDTIVDVLNAVVAHDAFDAVLLLGMGIQSNQAKLEEFGGFYPDFGLERIVSFHYRQDARYVSEALRLGDEQQKPVAIATELAIGDPENAAVRAVVDQGGYCFSSAERAVAALGQLYRRKLWLDHQ